MKLELKNNHFEISPISIDLSVGPADEEDWRDFTLKLHAGGDAPVAECTGSLTGEDCANMANRLRSATAAQFDDFEYAPLESWFIVRARSYSDVEVELFWMVDQGLARDDASTDTGVGVLMILNKTALAAALAEFQ